MKMMINSNRHKNQLFHVVNPIPLHFLSNNTDQGEVIKPPDPLKEREALLPGHAGRIEDKDLIENLLKEANNRLLDMNLVTSNAIWEWNMQTNRVFRNEQLMDMIGYPIESITGLTWWLDRIHADDRKRVGDLVKGTTDNNRQSWEAEYRFKCGDASYKNIRDRGFVVYENGLPVKMIGSLQDITAQKELEIQLTHEILQRQKEFSETVIRVQEKERTRIGYELHDNVNQILGAAKLYVDMLTPANETQKSIKAKSIEYLLLAVEEIRKLSKELVVPELKEKGLVNSIMTLVEDIELTTKIRIKFTHDHESDLISQGKKVTVFRIVQEQLKNTLKYANAKKVDICLYCKEENLQLMIRDDGIGFDPRQTSRGIGLSNIHERARFYNGTVDIQASPGKGCSLSVTIPAFQ